MRKLLPLSVVCIASVLNVFGQSQHNGDLSVLGSFSANGGTSSKPFTTVTSDPTGACLNLYAAVLNSNNGHISVCLSTGWAPAGNTLSVPSAGMVKSTGTAFAPAVAGTDYQSVLSFPLSLALGGTGTTTPGLVAGANVTITGTWPNQTVSAAGGTGGGNAISLQGNAVRAGAPTQGQAYLWNSVNSDFELNSVAAGLSVTGNGSFVEANSPTILSPSFGQTAPTQTYLVGTGGVTANYLVTSDSSGRAILPAVAGATFGISQTSVATVGSSVEVAVMGLAQCVMDGPAGVGDLAVSSSTTPGRCADSGTGSLASISSSTDVVGIIRSATTAAGQLARIQLEGIGVYGTQGLGGGGSGGGATNIQSLTDYAETANPNGLNHVSFNTGVAFPFNNQTCSFPSGHSFSISGSANDTVYIYADSLCNRTLGYNSANTYTLIGFENSNPSTNIQTFPLNTAPLEQCTIVGGVISGQCKPMLNWLARTTFASGAATYPTMTTAGLRIDVGYVPKIVSGTTYTFVQADQGSTVEFTNTGSVSVILPQPDSPGTGAFQSGWWAILSNPAGTGGNTVTISVATGTVNGSASLSLADGQAYMIISEGSAKSANGTYLALPFGGSSSSGGSFTGGTVPNGITVNSSTTTAFNTIEVLNDSGFGWQFSVGGSGVSAPYTNTNYIYDQNLRTWRILVKGSTWEFGTNTNPQVDGNIRTGTASNTDFAGEVTLTGAASASVTLAGAYTTHPECFVQPQFNTSASYYVTYPSANSISINFGSAVTGTVSYACVGRN